MRKIILIGVALTFIFLSTSGYCMINNNVYVVLSASKMESKPVLNFLVNKKKGIFNKVPYIQGKLGNKNIIVAQTGIGATNTASVTTSLIYGFKPKAIIFSGIAGGLLKSQKIGDVVVGEKIFEADFGHLTKNGPEFLLLKTWPNGVKQKTEPLMFRVNNKLFVVAKKWSGSKNNLSFSITPGTIASSQYFPDIPAIINLLVKQKTAAIAMEDAAIAKVGWMYDVPILIVRGISNIVQGGDIFTEKTANKAAVNAAVVTINTLKKV
jgi:adenosylhomocysteine nucleosidase